MVLVFVYGDRKPCSVAPTLRCPDDGVLQFNTQVAFDTDGTLLARYWKSHLYLNEPQFDAPATPDPVTFRSRALPSVVFGCVICYDSMYRRPLVQEQLDAGATHFVLSQWWVNTPPSLTGTMYQQALSRHYGIALIVANGVATPIWNNSGVSISVNGDVLASYTDMGTDVHDTLLVADVPTNVTALRRATAADVADVVEQQRDAARRGERNDDNDNVDVVVEHDDSEDDRRRHRRRLLHRQRRRRPLDSLERLRRIDVDERPAHTVAVAAHTSLSPANAEHAHAPAGEWGWQTFVASAGASATLRSSSGNLTCVASFAFDGPVPASADAEVFGVLAYAGMWREQYYEEHCGLYRCWALDTCVPPTAESHTMVRAFSLTALHSRVDLVPFQMAAAHNATLVAQSKFDVSAGSSYGRRFSTIAADNRTFDEPFLAASLVAIDMQLEP